MLRCAVYSVLRLPRCKNLKTIKNISNFLLRLQRRDLFYKQQKHGTDYIQIFGRPYIARAALLDRDRHSVTRSIEPSIYEHCSQKKCHSHLRTHSCQFIPVQNRHLGKWRLTSESDSYTVIRFAARNCQKVTQIAASVQKYANYLIKIFPSRLTSSFRNCM